MHKAWLSATALLVATAAPAAAATSATAIADLNVRSGPGPQYDVVGVIGQNDAAAVQGCLEGSLWCRVRYDGKTGWAYSKYLAAPRSGSRVVVAERRADSGIPTVRYEAPAGRIPGAAVGAVTGALIAGPVGAVVGGVAGAATGPMVIHPPARVRSYVTAEPVDPVYLDGEVVIGAAVPDTVVLHQVPRYDYRYAYVNRQPVLIEPGSRRIVYVYR